MESFNNHILLSKQALVSKIFIHLFRSSGSKTNKMKAALILKSDVLDIVFENRNKSYGAYNLRKYYDNRLTKSVGAMLGVVIILSAFSFMPKKKVARVDNGYITRIVSLPPAEKKKKEAEKPKEAKPQQPVKATAPTVPFTKPLIVNVETEVKPLTTLTDSVVIASVANAGKQGAGPVIGETGDKPNVGVEANGNKPAAPVATGVEVVEYAEVMPAYPGGIDALRRFLQKNLINPKEMEEGEEVTVKMKFVVGIDGKLQSFETVQDGGEEFDKEVMRVLKKMPNWVPGKTHGQNVSVYFTIPVKFVSAN